MKRLATVGLALGILALGTSAIACCGQSVMAAAPVTTTYYAPATSASVVTGSPMPTTMTATSYYAPVTTYYAPTVVEPVTTFYAPTTTYYAAPTTTFYAPYTTYYAPATTVYSPYTYTSNYAPGYVYLPGRVPGQPIRNLFRRY
ncbi:MAG: hypothetical protein IT427_14855 [Pirellulales bacterium]|nr:hypothetical protein [Pirellulales bacterium]